MAYDFKKENRMLLPQLQHRGEGAGLTGNNLSEVILSNSDNNYQYIIITAGILYAAALVICLLLVYQRPGKAVKN